MATNRIAFVLWAVCTASVAAREIGLLLVIPVALSLIALVLLRLPTHPIRTATAVAFTGAMLFFPAFLWYAPLLWFSVFEWREVTTWWIPPATVLLLLYSHPGLENGVGIVIIGALAVLLREQNDRLAQLRERYDTYFRDSREQQLMLLEANRTNAKMQDQNTTIAVLNERNRIARDLHDGLGHIVSRGVLQIGAMLITEPDGERRQQLELLQQSLQDGMQSLRISLHAQMSEDIDLTDALTDVVKEFKALPVRLVIDLKTEKDLNFKYSMLYIVREALHNIEKHSDATEASVSLRETRDAVFLLIQDNGNPKPNAPWGIGLISIQHRIESLNGTMEISTDNGFRLFCTLRKERP